MRTQLSDQVVLITGASAGIGRACAQELSRRGARLVLLDRTDGVHDLAGRLPRGSALALRADVTDRAQLDRAVAEAVQVFGRIDAVFANAGIAPTSPTTVLTTEEDVFDRVIGVNLLGVWNTVRATLPQIVASGGYVLLSGSLYSYLNGVSNAPYAMSKTAVESLARLLRVELAPHGASAGIVYPGWIDTDIVRSAYGGDPRVTALRRAGYPGPLGRLIPPERVADAVVRAMERRSPRAVVPSRWLPVFWARSLLNPLIDRSLELRPGFQKLLREVESEHPVPAIRKDLQA